MDGKVPLAAESHGITRGEQMVLGCKLSGTEWHRVAQSGTGDGLKSSFGLSSLGTTDDHSLENIITYHHYVSLVHGL